MSQFEPRVESPQWPVFELWAKYEDVAIHFNDLLLRLRSQALGAVAAISTIVGVLVNSPNPNWQLASATMLVLTVLWTALWIIDLAYYNRLLLGAVAAILVLERQSGSRSTVSQIDLSSMIAKAVAGEKPLIADAPAQRWKLLWGVWAFYILVFLMLVAAFLYCRYQMG